MIRVLLIAAACVGCAPPADYSGDYLPMIAVACGIAEVGGGAAPVTPDKPDGTPTPDNCPDMCGGGVLGDGTVVFDCPTCDSNGDGDPNDPAPRSEPVAKQDADAGPVWLTWREAHAEHERTGRPVLIVLHFADPEMDRGCLPCQRLKKTLADPETFAAFAELGIPCRDTAERWHPEGTKVTAPAIVRFDGEPRMVKNFSVAPAGDFLEEIKEWVDALD